MTKAEAAELQHRSVSISIELEYKDEKAVVDNYRCTTCSRSRSPLTPLAVRGLPASLAGLSTLP
jgi:hypothetical protein